MQWSLAAGLPPGLTQAIEEKLRAEQESQRMQFVLTREKQEADRKASELKKFKVPEFFVVQEPAAMRFAISLGIFSSREAAEERLETLRGKGVRSAKVGERDAKPTHGALEIRGPEAQAEVVRQASADWLPKNKPVTCKTGKPASQ